jgi:hypothetical protein
MIKVPCVCQDSLSVYSRVLGMGLLLFSMVWRERGESGEGLNKRGNIRCDRSDKKDNGPTGCCHTWAVVAPWVQPVLPFGGILSGPFPPFAPTKQ